MILTPVTSSQDHILGNLNAPIELVEFGDFECPHCASAYPIIKSVLTRFGNDVKFVFRNFPLVNVHHRAMTAALAAEAAGKQNKFWKMHDMLFEHQENLDKPSINHYAEMIGLSIPAFKSDMASSTIIQKVEADINSGMKSEVKGTPTFFINGKRFDYDWTGPDLPDYIEDLIPFARR
jgi:protein-disulfide isomerase